MAAILARADRVAQLQRPAGIGEREAGRGVDVGGRGKAARRGFGGDQHDHRRDALGGHTFAVADHDGLVAGGANRGGNTADKARCRRQERRQR